MPDSNARSHAPGVGERAPQERLVADRYRLVRELGRGGMGTVWLAEDELAGRQVAVKQLRPPQGLPDGDRETYRKRALREARSAARIHHPGAVTLYDALPATVADDAVYLIMELIDGPSLAELIGRHGPLPAATVAAWGLQLLSVLEAAHDLGVVHRDIKPANIMIAAGGQVKLTDFGIAHTMGDTRLTRTGVMGTHAYLAPELFESVPITPAADIWSLGATLYHAAEGHGAFDRDITSATLRAILLDDLPDPHCEPRLAAAITGMLQRDPARRATISQARSHLQAAAQAPAPAPPQVSPTPPPARTATTATAPEPPGAAPANPPPQWDRNATTISRSQPPAPASGPSIWSSGQQPDFAWIPERKGLSKLFMGAKKREDVASGRSLRVFVFPQGISWINGDEESSARWEEISAVFHKVVRHTTNGAHSFTEYYFTLKLADGRTRVFGGLLGVRKAQASEAARLHATPGVTTPVTIEQLGRLLENGVTRTQLPKAIDRFNAGQAISFGRLMVSPAGIAAGDQSLTWGEIQEVRTRQGIVSVKKAGKWLMWKTVHVSDIPNYFVFDALVRAILAQRG